MTHLNTRRAAIVVAAPAAALAAWALIRLIGVDLVLKSGRGTVGPADVLTAALVAALAGWLIVRQVERRSAQPQRLWALIGSTVLGASLIGPSWLADGASAVALICLHFVTAVVVVGGFAATLPARCGFGTAPRSGTIPG
jgi:Family of unknown function (DUF6069)